MAFRERIEKNTGNIFRSSEEGKYFPVVSRYTAGVAGQKFLEEIKENEKIFGTRCSKCEITFVPAKLYCERCFARMEKEHWVDVGTRGTLYSYTVAYEEKDGSPKETPSIIGAIKLGDGLLFHWIKESSADDLEIGMEVDAVFKPKGERRGSLVDIDYFKPKK